MQDRLKKRRSREEKKRMMRKEKRRKKKRKRLMKRRWTQMMMERVRSGRTLLLSTEKAAREVDEMIQWIAALVLMKRYGAPTYSTKQMTTNKIRTSTPSMTQRILLQAVDKYTTIN